MTSEQHPSMKVAFIKWAMTTPGVWNRPEFMLRDLMEDSETTIGLAWLSWKACWRARR